MNDAHHKYVDQPTLILLINECGAPLGELKPKMIISIKTKCHTKINTHMCLLSLCHGSSELEISIEGKESV